MKLVYQGIDITSAVQIRKCEVKDMASDRSDSIDIEFEEAGKWYQWAPQRDDVISVSLDGYDSGRMYVHAITPENGKYKILASSRPCTSYTKKHKSFIGKTIGQIMEECARETGMGYEVYGISEKIVIPYAEQSKECEAAFLNRLLGRESCVLKIINGKYVAISIPWAQEREAVQSISVRADDKFVMYFRSGMKYRSFSVRSPFGKAVATDTSVSENECYQTANLPVRDDVQAFRWGRGELLKHNRECEHVFLKTKYNPAMTAMMRVNLEGDTDMSGAWLVEEAIHDLRNKTTTVKLRRCIFTIQ